jgi:exodeoxyribonuclease V alpha subunit
VAEVVRLVKEDIPSKFGFRPVDDIQVLTPMQRQEIGARNLNLLLQGALNPTGPSVARFGWTFRVGNKMMQTVNEDEKDVFNGDLARVEAAYEVEQEVAIRYEGKVVAYDFGEPDELQPAYAVTVHKSQGSEYPVVAIPSHTQHYTMRQRNLLYTAVTRGRRLVVLVGTRRAMAMAIKRTESQKRVTTLRQRLVGQSPINVVPSLAPRRRADAAGHTADSGNQAS